jgi:hypothetical protein
MKKSFIYASLVLAMAITLFTACGSDGDGDDKGSGTKDARISQVIPAKYRTLLEKYIPIYDGVNPPNVEGIYLKSPNILVFDSENDYEAGRKFVDMYYQLSGQNMTNNTINDKEVAADGNTDASGSGAFISGSDNNFTIFFNQVGTSQGVYTKKALIISGTKTSTGIKNFHTAWVMIEKGDDPDDKIVSAGAYRVFKDGDGEASKVNSLPSSAPTRSQSIDELSEVAQ